MTRIVADGPAIPYAPPEVVNPNPFQVLTVFTPEEPRGGILIHTDSGNFLDSPPCTVFDDAVNTDVTWITSLWSKGVTIVSAGLSGFDGAHPGGALFREYDSTEYLDSYEFTWPEREAEWIVQKVHNLATFGGIDGHASKIGWFGQSSGAVCGMAVGLGPDRRRTTGSAQVRTSTLLRFIVAIEPPFWWPAYAQDEVPGLHFPTGGVGSTGANKLGDAPVSFQENASPLTWLGDRFASGLAMPPMYLAYDEAVESTCFDLEPNGKPSLFDVLTSVHPYWHGMIAGTALRQVNLARWNSKARLVAAGGIEQPPPNDIHHLAVGSMWDAVMQPDLENWILTELRLAGPVRVPVEPPIDPSNP